MLLFMYYKKIMIFYTIKKRTKPVSYIFLKTKIKPNRVGNRPNRVGNRPNRVGNRPNRSVRFDQGISPVPQAKWPLKKVKKIFQSNRTINLEFF